MVRFAVKFSFLEASCCKVEVINGGEGDFFLFPFSLVILSGLRHNVPSAPAVLYQFDGISVQNHQTYCLISVSAQESTWVLISCCRLSFCTRILVLNSSTNGNSTSLFIRRIDAREISSALPFADSLGR